MMGYVVHRATVVTSFSEEVARRASEHAVGIFGAGMVTQMHVSPVNSYFTFAIMPCGSKSGWSDKDDDDARRSVFLAWVAEQAYDDGSSPLEVADVQYGSDFAALAAQ